MKETKCAWCERPLGLLITNINGGINGPYCSLECTSQWMLGQMQDKDEIIEGLLK